MNKKLLISLSTIAAVAVIAVGGTIAYFSDTETSTGNTFTAGTLELTEVTTGAGTGTYTVDPSGGINGKVLFTNMVPGQSGSITWTLKNEGTVNGYLDFEKSGTFTTFTVGAEPEAETSVTGNDAINGDLDSYLGVKLARTIDTTTVYLLGNAGTYAAASGLEAVLNAEKDTALNAGKTAVYTLSWDIPSDIPSVDDNIIQGDGMGLSLTFELGQDITQ